MSKNIIKKIFTDNIPTKIYNGKKCFDWLNSKGINVHFIYGNIEGDILIKDINKSKKCTRL